MDTAGQIRSGGAASITAGRDIAFNTVTTGASYQAAIGASSLSRQTSAENAGQVTVGTDLGIQAGRDLTLNGTQITAGGNATVLAGRNLTLDVATSTQTSDQRNDPSGSQYRQTRSSTDVQGARIQAGGDLVAMAGLKEAGDLHITASQLDAKGRTQLDASRDIVIDTARQTSALDDYARIQHLECAATQ